ncbi:hypothetical protein EUTSA_v100021781mg, partial [Eutrema salsugineum]
ASPRSLQRQLCGGDYHRRISSDSLTRGEMLMKVDLPGELDDDQEKYNSSSSSSPIEPSSRFRLSNSISVATETVDVTAEIAMVMRFLELRGDLVA